MSEKRQTVFWCRVQDDGTVQYNRVEAATLRDHRSEIYDCELVLIRNEGETRLMMAAGTALIAEGDTMIKPLMEPFSSAIIEIDYVHLSEHDLALLYLMSDHR